VGRSRQTLAQTGLRVFSTVEGTYA